MLYSQELADRATAWLARPLTNTPDGKRSAEGLLELATIWAAINRQALPECIRQCQYSERAATLRNYLPEFSRFQNPEIMSDSSYQLAPKFANETLVDEGLNGAYTAANLTDEVAEFFIKKGRSDLFVKKGEAAKSETEPAAGDAASEADSPELKAEKEAHEATKQALDTEKEAHTASKTKAADTLKAEKEAHKATKKELSEVQKQLVEANKQLADIAAKAEPTTPAPTEPAQ